MTTAREKAAEGGDPVNAPGWYGNDEASAWASGFAEGARRSSDVWEPLLRKAYEHAAHEVGFTQAEIDKRAADLAEIEEALG